MRTHTSEFKEELKVFGRQIKGKITYYPSYYLISEEEDNILTETDLQIISEQANYDEPIEISEEDIFSISIIKNGDLLQSLMKEFDFESKIELNIGSVVNPQLGLLVNDDYEYLNYGNYIINSKEFNMDTETWSYVCYDKMLFSMVKYRELSNVQYPITIKQFINNLCNKVGLEFEDSTFVNQDQLIYEDLYKNRNVTYRDIFDEISKIVAGNLLINDSDKLEVGYPNKASNSENAIGSNITIEAEEEKLLDVKLEGNMQQNESILPDIYTQVDYIESSGMQYIDTGRKSTPNTKFDFEYLSLKQTGQLFQNFVGSQYGTSKNRIYIQLESDNDFTLQFPHDSSTILYMVNDGTFTSSNTKEHVKINYNEKSHIIYDLQNRSVTLNELTCLSTSTYEITPSDYNILIFNRNDTTIPNSNMAVGKLYNFKWYENNVLIMNLIPCYRNSDNEVGLYDVANNVFYTNQGTGVFTYGSIVNIPSPDYPQDIEVVTGEQNITISQNGNLQNYLIDLHNIELCKIGDYKDYIYNQNGSWYLHKEIAKHTFYTSEDTNSYNTDLEDVLAINLYPNGMSSMAFKNISRGYWVYCNNFKYKQSISNEEHVYLTASVDLGDNNYYGNIRLYINHNRLSGYSSSLTNNQKRALVVSWLQQNPTTIYYATRYPEDTQITSTTLIQQLNNLKNATLYNGINNIIVSGDLPIILNIDYISEYESINEDYLKDTNVKMSEKIGVINSVAILDSDNNLEYVAEDTQSIKENEMTKVTITDNLIAMNGETQEIADNILNKLNGLYYYANDLQTTGVCYYDFLDLFNVEARGNIYQCLLLNNEITITQGIEEHIFTERFEEIETSKEEYVTSVMTNKQASLRINQQEAKIEARVEKDGIISAINLSPEEIQIEANKISLEGKEINLTSDDIIIESTNFSVDKDGKITATAGEIGGFITNNYSFSKNVFGLYNYNNFDSTMLGMYLVNQRVSLNDNLINVLDVDSDGEVSSVDYVKIRNIINGTSENTKEVSATFEINSNNPKDCVVVKDENGNIVNSIGVGGINSTCVITDNFICGKVGESYSNFNGATINGTTGNITCVSLTQTSKEENKKNFERLTNAKDILNQVDIYKYNFKDEDDNIKKSIGFVIGDNFNYSKEITSESNDGANIYSMVSVLWQVVKEQQEEINELKEMIKNGKY